jgi:hypothetical protein
MLKNESAQNATKPATLRLSRLPDSGGIFTSSNGLRMSKISRSVQKAKQVKKGMIVQSVQSTWHADCADRTVHTTDVVILEGNMWQVQEATRVRQIWTYGQTAGPIQG